MRSNPVRIRDTIGLIEAGSGLVVGLADIVDCLGPLSLADRLANEAKHCVPARRWIDPETSKYQYAWVLASARRLPKPVRYNHPKGAQSFVKLDPDVTKELGFLCDDKVQVAATSSLHKESSQSFVENNSRRFKLLPGQKMNLSLKDVRSCANDKRVIVVRWYPAGSRRCRRSPESVQKCYDPRYWATEVNMDGETGEVRFYVDSQRVEHLVQLLNLSGTQVLTVELKVEVSW